MDDLRVFGCAVPKGAETLDFEIGIAANAWRTTHTFKELGDYGTGPDKAQVVDYRPGENKTPDGVRFRVNLAPGDRHLRLVAVDEGGGIHKSTGSWWMGSDAHGLDAIFADLPHEKVKEYR